jgi:hypothetical protein
MIAVPDNVEFAYNGFFFNSSVRTKVTEEPIASGDNRVVKYSKISIHTTGVITQDDVNDYAAIGVGDVGGTLDALMRRIRQTLQVHGKNLKYVNKGYGVDLNVNANPAVENSIRDCAMGPKAGKFTWWPLGGAPDGVHAAGFEWEVSTCVAECQYFPLNPGVQQFVEISYNVVYDCDEAGLVTITVSGVAQIPLSLRADNTLDRTIDDSITAIIRPVPLGFLRRHSRTISADRATANFTIVDTQKEIGYPDDVVVIDMHHRIKQRNNSFNQLWDCSITGTVRLTPTANRFLAYRRFMSIAARRMAFARRHVAPGLTNNRGIFVRTTEMDEDLFKNESRFTINYTLLGAKIQDIVKVSGLWRPLQINVVGVPPEVAGVWDLQTWNESLTPAQKFKGIIGATFDRQGDVILDVCAGPVSSQVVPAAQTVEVSPAQVAANAETTDSDFEDTDLSQVVADDQFDPEYSWVGWQCMVTRLVNHNVVTHKPLAGTVTYDTPPVDPFGPVANVATNTDAPKSTYSADTEDVLQQVASPTLRVRVQGYGIRMQHRVNQPKLLSYGGRAVALMSEDVSEEIHGGIGNQKLYRTNWDLIYAVVGPPNGTLPLLANPVNGVDGEGPTGQLQNPLDGGSQ